MANAPLNTPKPTRDRPQVSPLRVRRADYPCLNPSPVTASKKANAAMLDNTSTITSAALQTSGTTDCPACGIPFIPGRKNQAYCSRCCQKKSSQNASRGFRHLENFARDEHEAARAKDLRETLYAAPPVERLGIMKDILDAAYHDGGLRNILTRPELLSDRPFSAGRGRMNIAKAADAYCKKFLQMSVRSYIRHVRAELDDNRSVEPLDVHIVVVKDKQQRGPVPQLRPKLTQKNVKCIHKALPEGATQDASEVDFERVSRICKEVQERVDALDLDHNIPLCDPKEDEVLSSIDGRHRVTSDKRDTKRKIALSQICFDRGVSINSHMGRTLASSMGISSL